MKTTPARYAVGVRQLPPRLKRWTLKLTLALLAGAVVTWAVAWGCAILPSDLPGPPVVVATTGEAAAARAASLGIAIRRPGVPTELETVEYAAVGLRFLTTSLNQHLESRSPAETYGVTLNELKAGWPLLALRCRQLTTAHTFEDRGATSEQSDQAVYLPPRIAGMLDRQRRGLPTRPLPLGFTLNTLLAAAVILTLTEGAWASRRRARRRKGKCPWCGYDRAGVPGDAACPECGRMA